LATLQCQPQSMLGIMFSGRHMIEFDEKDGSVFIDRDGTHFRYILNYLRDGNVLLPTDKVVIQELLKEAEFYQLQELTEKIIKQIDA